MVDRVEQARRLQAAMVEDRRHLHAHPEVGLDLPATTEHLVAVLTGLGLDPEHHPGAGVSARIAGRAPSGTTRVLRADMDALPVTEATGLPFSSQTPGAMHACGHDLHMAMLLGAARGFVEEVPEDDVVLVFQPGEETDRGAVPTLASHTTLPEDDATAFAVHVHATWPAHTVHHRAGTFMAYGDWFEASFTGPGGHASQPHLAGNPVEAGARFVLGAHNLVSALREHEHLVTTVTESLAGNTVNVIPTDGRLRGTLRTLSPEQRAARRVGGLRHRGPGDGAAGGAHRVGVAAVPGGAGGRVHRGHLGAVAGRPLVRFGDAGPGGAGAQGTAAHLRGPRTPGVPPHRARGRDACAGGRGHARRGDLARTGRPDAAAVRVRGAAPGGQPPGGGRGRRAGGLTRYAARPS